MQVPDAIEPAVGYRAWLVKDGRIYSYAHQEVMWEPRMPFEAFCGVGRDHDVPDPRCSCGLYAAMTFNRLFDMGYTKSSGLFAAKPGQVTIAGQVSLWGNIIPGEIGWRAQLAYPKKFLIPYTKWKIAVELSEVYGVPFSLYNLERIH